MVRRARRLALSRGLGHADVWDAAGGRPAYGGNDDAAAREIDPRFGARPDLRRDPRHELRKSRQPGAGIFRSDHSQIRRHPARPAGARSRAARGHARRAVVARFDRGEPAALSTGDDARRRGHRGQERPRLCAGRHLGRYPPTEWARLAIAAYATHRADRIVAEVNNGGDMVGATLRMIDPNVAFTAV